MGLEWNGCVAASIMGVSSSMIPRVLRWKGGGHGPVPIAVAVLAEMAKGFVEVPKVWLVCT